MDQDQVHELLGRAEEIQTSGLTAEEDGVDVDQLVQAAEEAGLNRGAVLQALRERIDQNAVPLEAKALVFAKSADGCYYPATVKAQDGSFVSIKYTNGSTATVRRSDIKLFSAAPGHVYNCPRNRTEWWDCTIDDYDSRKKLAYMIDPKGNKHWFYFKEMRICPPGLKPARKSLPLWVVYLAVSLSSGALGAVVMRLLTH